jgi:hypothetical protein
MTTGIKTLSISLYEREKIFTIPLFPVSLFRKEGLREFLTYFLHVVSLKGIACGEGRQPLSTTHPPLQTNYSMSYFNAPFGEGARG